jgi:O-antigen ligase
MQNLIKSIVWISLCIIPFIALYIANGSGMDVLNWGTAGMFFPFISGKNIIFRVLVEIALAGWVLLALMDSKYRINIRTSPLTIAYAIFIGIIFIADIFGVDPVNSLWSNYERMEGFVGHIHLFAYFFVLTAMLRTLKDWQIMFKVFLASNVAVLSYGYAQLMGAPGYIFSDNMPKLATWFAAHFPVHQGGNRLDATIGNAAYFSIFCLISAFIAALLWLQSDQPKKKWWYPTLIVLNLIAIFYSGTRGTILGLGFGIFVTLGLMAWYEKGHARKIFAGFLVAMIISVGTLLAFRETAFVKSSSTLYRLSHISVTDLTTMSRINIWKISYQAWLERPILGYGQDNFSYIYARKFIPEKMWDLEPWYDRSHDVFFDWLVAGGILGLVSYLSLYAVALYLMWRKKHDMPFRERAILTGVLAGYFVHNIIVFDNLTSYILFFALLGYIVMRTKGDSHGETHGKALVTDEQMKLLWMPIVGIVLVSSLYYINYRPFMVNRHLVYGMNIQQLLQTMPFADAVKLQEESFKKAISANTLGTEEAREQFLQMGVRLAQVTIPENISEKERQSILQAISSFIASVRKDIDDSYEAHKEDVRMLSIYGMFYNGIGDPVSAEKVLTQARTFAPKKQLIAFDMIRSYLMQKKYQQAYALSSEVYATAPKYQDAIKWYLLSATYAGDFKTARARLIQDGQIVPFDADILNAIVNTGQIALAVELLNELKRTNPEYTAQIDAYLKTLPR